MQFCTGVSHQHLKTVHVIVKNVQVFEDFSKNTSSISLVKNMGVLYYALQELTDLSSQLQNRDISVVEAHTIVCLQICVFEAMVNKSGKHVMETAKAATKMSFYDVPPHDGPEGIVTIHAHQFFQSSAKHLKSKLLAMRNSCTADSSDDLVKELQVVWQV
jgi:hypothetical protein